MDFIDVFYKIVNDSGNTLRSLLNLKIDANLHDIILLHAVFQKPGLHLHHIVEGVDEAHLQVQAGVLIQVPGGGVLLRPEDGADLKDPLEGAHHSLLIELGGLGEKCLAPEVVQPEDVAAPLGPGVDDLGGVDLGEALDRRAHV